MYLEVNNTEKVGKNIARIKKSVDHLNGILNDFLSLEKLETGKVEYNQKSFNLSDFIEDVLEDTKNTFRKGQNAIVNLKGDDMLELDPFLLKNILFNLISNAVKYSPEDKNIFLNIENLEYIGCILKMKFFLGKAIDESIENSSIFLVSASKASGTIRIESDKCFFLFILINLLEPIASTPITVFLYLLVNIFFVISPVVKI